MKRLKELFRRVLYLGRRNNFDSELDEEMRFHLETRIEELTRRGLTPSEAAATARREFGSVTRAQENTRDAWQFQWLTDLFADLRYAFRALRRDCAFALVAILSLALGIGVNTTIFSLTMEFLFSEPSARQPETLVRMRLGGNSHAEMRYYRFVRDAHLFTALGGMREQAEANWRYGDDTRRVFVFRVTENYFDVVGVPLAIGRGIQSGEQDTVVLSYRFWQNRLAGQPDILGRKLVFDGKPFTVVGVLPSNHRTLLGFGLAPDVYLPIPRNDETQRVALIARLSDGMSRPEAFARLAALSKEMDHVFPRPAGHGSWAQNTWVNGVTGIDRLESIGALFLAPFFGLLMILVGLVLFIACANVASLLLARAASRRQELAIRLAIGAGRVRLIRQLLTESLLLAVMGTLTGFALNLFLTSLFNRIQFPLPIPLQLSIQPDWRLLTYSIAIALLTALVSGFVPALKATRADVNAALKQEERQVSGRRWNLRTLLVAGQLAVSILLLATGFLFLRNLMMATTLGPGFNIDHTIWSYMRLVPEKYPTAEKVGPFMNNALDALRTLPSVESVSLVKDVPLNNASRTGIGVQTDLDDNPKHLLFYTNWVGTDYFKTMEIPILRGREFQSSDRAGSPEVAIINQEFARRCFGDINPIGHTIRFSKPMEKTSLLIVGVAKTSKHRTVGEAPEPALYTPYLQHQDRWTELHFLIRASQPPESLVKAINQALGNLDASASIETKPMNQALGLAFLPSRVGAALMGSIGVLGLALASIGLYGVLIYSVSRRIREIGLRMALGASRGAILRMVLRDSFILVAAGMIVGLGLAFFVTKPLAMFLVPELSPTDPITFLAVIGVLLLVAAAATTAPVLRALRVDPMTALRYE